MNLALACNSNYATPGRVLLKSLREFCREPVQIHLLHCQTELGPLESICREFSVNTVHVRPSWLDSLPRLPSHSQEAYLPLCLAQALPDLERVLFLDVDTLCLSDLRPLWETDLRGKVVGAVCDLSIPTFSSPRGVRCWRQLGLWPHQPYFNAGVLLIDLNLWRVSRVTEEALEYLDKYPVHFLHQEALNVVLRNRWLPLEVRWNVIASLYQRRYSPPALASVSQPCLIHYAGRFKPWEVCTHGWPGRIYSARCHPPSPSWLGFYDNYLRDWLYPLERWFWARL